MTQRRLPDYTCPRDGCGVSFRPTVHFQKYCSRECADLARRKVREVVCRREACRREFTVQKREKVYCSWECSLRDRTERRPRKTCPRCSKEFTVRQSRAETQTYCSDVCAKAARAVPETECPACETRFKPKQRRQQFCSVTCSQVSARRVRPMGPRPAAITCEPCGRTFHPPRKDQRFCSRECGFEGQSRSATGRSRPGTRPSTPPLAPVAPPSVDIPAAPTQREVLIWRPDSWGGTRRVTIGSGS